MASSYERFALLPALVATSMTLVACGASTPAPRAPSQARHDGGTALILAGGIVTGGGLFTAAMGTMVYGLQGIGGEDLRPGETLMAGGAGAAVFGLVGIVAGVLVSHEDTQGPPSKPSRVPVDDGPSAPGSDDPSWSPRQTSRGAASLDPSALPPAATVPLLMGRF